jgi:integrative and conjugative element protein (TIGR02256 family)
MLRYDLPGGRRVVFTDEVARSFHRHRQFWPWSEEAGGQLFATLGNVEMEVSKAKGPFSQDQRGRYFFRPDRQNENRVIENCFVEGLHYVGDWHTHPEKRPAASPEDLESIAECFKNSSHELVAFLLVIVGTNNPPEGLWVGWHDGNTTVRLFGVKE